MKDNLEPAQTDGRNIRRKLHARPKGYACDARRRTLMRYFLLQPPPRSQRCLPGRRIQARLSGLPVAATCLAQLSGARRRPAWC
jgi:hypothetical protein